MVPVLMNLTFGQEWDIVAAVTMVPDADDNHPSYDNHPTAQGSPVYHTMH